MTPAGLASPHFKHGRRSRYLPARLRGEYGRALKDTELVSLRRDLALIEVRLNELLSRLDGTETAKAWAALSDAMREVRAAVQSGEVARLTNALNAMSDLIERGADAEAAWAEVLALLEQRRKLAQTEHARLIAMEQFVSREQAELFAHAVLGTVSKHADRDTARRIFLDVQRLLGPVRVDSGGELALDDA